ncbi:hypothetical protein BCR44DRAFT_1435652, partial [Catenaria anguillulae PL171]
MFLHLSFRRWSSLTGTLNLHRCEGRRRSAVPPSTHAHRLNMCMFSSHRALLRREASPRLCWPVGEAALSRVSDHGSLSCFVQALDCIQM